MYWIALQNIKDIIILSLTQIIANKTYKDEVVVKRRKVMFADLLIFNFTKLNLKNYAWIFKKYILKLRKTI